MTRLIRAMSGDMDTLLPLMAAYHAFEGIDTTEDQRRLAVGPLLGESPHGTVWLIADRPAAPGGAPGPIVGYVAISYGWSLELGGLDGFVDELYILPEARGQGAAREALREVIELVQRRGMRTLHMEVAHENAPARQLYETLGFKARARFHLMSLSL